MNISYIHKVSVSAVFATLVVIAISSCRHAEDKISNTYMDRLYEEWKNVEIFTLDQDSAYGATVIIKKNRENKPSTISITGTVSEQRKIDVYFNRIAHDLTSDGFELTDDHVYTKGELYYKYAVAPTLTSVKESKPGYFFSIEYGDKNRIAN